MQADLPILELHRSGARRDGQQRSPDVHVLDAEGMARFLSSTPAAILVDSDGTVLRPPVVGPEEIEALVRLVLESKWVQT